MIAIIDYNAGNIASVQNALDRLDMPSFVSADPAKIITADKIIFPGVGRAGMAMKELKTRGLDSFIKEIKKPFLGICLGMQLLAEFSEEDNTKCLGLLPGKVRRFPNLQKVPQIGWNKVEIVKDNLLFKDVLNGSYFYFVNSYYLEAKDNYTIGQTHYGMQFAAAIQQNNFFGTQFHPEKSGSVGEQVLRNFCKIL